jgi:hypothetical protein
VLAALVDTKALWQTVVVSAVAGIGITVAFAIMVFGVTRSADMVRQERPVLATAAGGLAALGLLVVVGSIVLGIVVMAAK